MSLFLNLLFEQIANSNEYLLAKSASIQPRTSPSKFEGKFNSIFIRLLNATAESDEAPVRMLDAVEGLARLAERADVLRVHIEVPRGAGLLLRDVDRANPRAVHAEESLEVRARVNDANVHGAVDLRGLLLAFLQDLLDRGRGDVTWIGSKFGLRMLRTSPQRRSSFFLGV